MRIACCGSASSSVRLTPFKDKSWAQFRGAMVDKYPTPPHIDETWKIWGCSPGFFGYAQRADRWFEVHRWEPGMPWLSPEYVEFLRNFKGPVYTGGRVEELPNHVVYPIDRLEETFSSYFMTSSLALMVAMAIDEIEQIRAARRAKDRAMLPRFVEAEELEKSDEDDIIGMWGVDMATQEEYAYQRPGCQFFILEAMRRGIGVYLPPESDLMRPMPVYGISEWDHNYIKLTARARELSGRAGELQQQIQTATQTLAGVQGESHALQAFVSTWTSPYGMQHGMVIRHTPGTGLGSGITHFDGRPVARMKIEEAPVSAAPDPEAEAAKQVLAELKSFCAQTSTRMEVEPGATMKRLLAEAAAGRALSSELQAHAMQGEETVHVVRRLVSERDAALSKPRARRR